MLNYTTNPPLFLCIIPHISYILYKKEWRMYGNPVQIRRHPLRTIEENREYLEADAGAMRPAMFTNHTYPRRYVPEVPRIPRVPHTPHTTRVHHNPIEYGRNRSDNWCDYCYSEVCAIVAYTL
jgi:hypothetical protein